MIKQEGNLYKTIKEYLEDVFYSELAVNWIYLSFHELGIYRSWHPSIKQQSKTKKLAVTECAAAQALCAGAQMVEP